MHYVCLENFVATLWMMPKIITKSNGCISTAIRNNHTMLHTNCSYNHKYNFKKVLKYKKNNVNNKQLHKIIRRVKQTENTHSYRKNIMVDKKCFVDCSTIWHTVNQTYIIAVLGHMTSEMAVRSVCC